MVGAVFENPGNKFLDDLMSLLSEESGKLHREDVSCCTICCNQCEIDVL